MKSNLPSIQAAYGFVGANCCEVTLRAHFDKEQNDFDSYMGIDLINDYGEVMKTVFALGEAITYIQELKNGKYARERNPFDDLSKEKCEKCVMGDDCPGYYDGCYEFLNSK